VAFWPLAVSCQLWAGLAKRPVRSLRFPFLYCAATGRWPLCGEKGGALSAYFKDYVSVAAFIGLGVFLVLLFLTIASFLRPSNPHAAKLLTYECGVDPVGADWSQSQVRYYIYALLFVVFDVEAVFIFPWAVTLEKLGAFGLGEMLLFIVVLLVGLVYAIRKGVLKWV